MRDKIRPANDYALSLSLDQSKCKYYAMCKHRRSELPCTIGEVAESYCKVYRLFHNTEVRDTDHALTA